MADDVKRRTKIRRSNKRVIDIKDPELLKLLSNSVSILTSRMDKQDDTIAQIRKDNNQLIRHVEHILGVLDGLAATAALSSSTENLRGKIHGISKGIEVVTQDCRSVLAEFRTDNRLLLQKEGPITEPRHSWAGDRSYDDEIAEEESDRDSIRDLIDGDADYAQ